jgi:hypothetical protein
MEKVFQNELANFSDADEIAASLGLEVVVSRKKLS